MDQFYSELTFSSKYGKKRLKVDLNFLQKGLKNLNFLNEDLVAPLISKLNTISTAMCGGVTEEVKEGEGEGGESTKSVQQVNKEP